MELRILDLVDQWGKTIINSDHITQKTLIILYELPPLLSFMKKKKEWQNECFDIQIVKFYQRQILVLDDCSSKTIVILCHTSKRHLRKIHIMYFLVLKENFVTILNLVGNVSSSCFKKVKIVKFKGQLPMVTSTV